MYDGMEDYEDYREEYKERRTGRRWAPAVWGAVLVAALVLAFTSYYQLGPSEKGVVTTWGRITDVASQGPHMLIPFIEDVAVVDIEKINRETFGYTDEDQNRNVHLESYKITKDGKVANVFYVVQYKISDPVSYVLNPPKSPGARRRVIRDIMESNMSDVINGMTVDDIWTTGKERLQDEARVKIQEAFNNVKFGIAVKKIVIQETETPDAKVNEAFRDVNSALSEKDSKILVAKKEASKMIAQTDGEVAKILNRAQSIADSRLYTAKGECERIKALAEQFNKDPEMTKRTLYLEMVGAFLKKNKDNIVFVEGANNLNVLPLDGFFGGAAAGAGKEKGR